MKKTIKFISILAIVLSFSACSDYLEIVPDERPTEEDAFRNPNDAQSYLYSIYGYIPEKRHGNFAIDLLTAGEISTSNSRAPFSKFVRGEYTASQPVISYWSDLYKGIRQAYILIDNVDSVVGLTARKANAYKAEANFLIGYFHFLLLRMYGPIVIADHQFDINLPSTEYPLRSTYDESVDFIVKKLDDAAQELPMEQPSSSDYGRATSVIAKALKARMLLYAASPLFNGGGVNKQSLYANFTNIDGEKLISSKYDKAKWKLAADASKEAIDIALAAGKMLYKNSEYDSELPADPIEKDLRYVYIDKRSKEIIWGETRTEGPYHFQNKSTPYISGRSWNNMAPTLTMLESFYTENGLPIDKDPAYDYGGRYDIDSTELGNTLALNLHREPRFNAWISYHNSYYEIIRGNKKQVLTQYRRNDPHGIQGRTSNYSTTGYLNKKGVAPLLTQERLGINVDYPWPKIRLAELYLNYAEALIEYGQDFTTAKDYIDKVRRRAGIPTVDEAWAPIGGADNQSTLRDIVRQERTIEFYLENMRFWDLRRWQIAEDYLDQNARGMNIQGETDKEFFKVTKVPFPQNFYQRNYLMPIPQTEMNKNELLTQNPGY